VVFLEHLAKIAVRQFQGTDGFAMCGEFNYERMMQVHWNSSGWKVGGHGSMFGVIMPW